MKKRCLKLIIIPVFGLVFATQAHAATITVNSLTDDGPGNCSTQCTFRDAVATASSGDTINFTGLTGTITIDSGASIDIDKNLTITGPGADVLSVDFDAVEANHVDHSAGTLNISGLTFINGAYALKETGTGTLNITDFIFDSNSGYSSLFLLQSDGGVTLTRVQFTNNEETNDFAGGAMYIYSADVTIIDSTFTNNTGGEYGGLIDLEGDNVLTITGSTFSGNSTSYSGGVLYTEGAEGATITITNSTFVDNTTEGDPGSVMNATLGAGGSITITNSTFYNTVAGQDSIILIDTSGGGTALLTNNIFYSVDDNNCAANYTSGGYNIDSGTSCGFAETGDLSSTDPLLDTVNGLQDNGGDVETVALLTGSPAIDAATSASAPATDARGISRPQGSADDMGAYEYEITTPTVTTTSSSSVTTTTATLTGNITATGGESNTARGFNYGLTTSYGTNASESGTYSTGSYSLDITGLTCATTYHFRAYSTNSAGTGTGSDSTFTTSACPTSSSGGSSAGSRARNLIAMGKVDQAQQILKQYPNAVNELQNTSVPPTVTPTTPTKVNTQSITSRLSRGTNSPQVSTLQEFLNTLGYNLKIDGKFGPQTEQVVKIFQASHNLTPDGVVGPLTRGVVNGM